MLRTKNQRSDIPQNYGNPVLLVPIAMLYVTVGVITISLAYKVATLFGFDIIAGTLIVPVWLAIADIVAEVYGYQEIRRMIWWVLFCEFIFVFTIVGVMHLPSPEYWHHQQAYNFVFGHLPRVFFASVAAVVVASFANAYVLARSKVLLKGRRFWLRCLGSSVVGEAVFTMITITINYWGIYGTNHLFELAIDCFVFKIVVSVILTVPLTFAAMWVKRVEGIDVYDYNTNFNPFKLGRKHLKTIS